MIAAATVLGWLVRDVMLTADDVDCLLEELLVSSETPTGRVRLTEWLADHADELGRTYASELDRHYR
jgi:hypothetical protein